jgi:transcriptional regulator with XRE-family HTH domain
MYGHVIAHVYLGENRGTELINEIDFVKLSVTPARALSAGTVPHTSILLVPEQTGANGKTSLVKIESDRDVIRCITCGMVQYRTRNGNCRRCLQLLTPKIEFLTPPPDLEGHLVDDRRPFEKWPNRDTVENIGQRIRQLRESRGMTQTQLHVCSRISRSYLSRIENGQMTPSLGTLEKISEAFGIGLNRFFVPETNGEALLEDPFIQGLRPFLRQLDWEQWQSILKRLAAISDHVSTRNGGVHNLAQPRPAIIENVGRRNYPAAISYR